MRAVVYARYSSHSQTEQSIEGQVRDCREYAKREGLTLVGEYIDRAISGQKDDRPDFQRMIADARKKQFDYVIVWKLDRFARNRYDSATYKHKLKQSGVRVLSAMENIGEGDESIILEAVLEASAEYYSRDLSKKVRRGLRETAMKGGFLGGICPIGYKVEDGKVLIDEEKAPAIVYAFEEYAAGTSKKDIMAALRGRGVRGVKGAALTYTSFAHALKNPKYTGIYEHGEITMTNYPALISGELFDAVQARLKERSHAPAASKGTKSPARMEYLLQGKAFCGMCGARLVGESGAGKMGTKFFYYACGQKKKLHNCTKSNEKKDFVEWYVVEQTVEFVLNPSRIGTIAEAVVAEYDREFNDEAVKALEKRIAKIELDIENAVKMLIQSGSTVFLKQIEKQVEEWTAQKDDLTIDLSKLQIANGIRYTVDEIKAWLRQFCKGDLMDPEFRRRVIDVFINSVYLYDDKIAIFYNMKNGKQISYIDVAEVFDGEPENGGAEPQSGVDGGVRISALPPRQSIVIRTH